MRLLISVVVIRQGCWRNFIAETSRLVLLRIKVPKALIFPGPSPIYVRRGHFYFGSNRTFLLWLDSGEVFS